MNHKSEYWFKARPKNADSVPNAIYKRQLSIVGGEMTCLIEYKSKQWIVRESELKDTKTALKELAQKWHDEIEKAKNSVKKETKRAIADMIGICVATYNKRVEFVDNYYEKKTEIV